MTNIRAELLVSGGVTKRGYRAVVEEKAIELGIKGNVRNLPDGNVKVVCEGEKENIEKFINAIDIKERFIKVVNIDKKFSKAVGKFKDFKIIREKGWREIGESTEAGAIYLRALWEDTNKNFDKMDIKYGGISEKMNKFGEITSESVKTLKSISEKMGKFEESMSETIKTLREDRTEMKQIAGAIIEAIKSFKAG